MALRGDNVMAQMLRSRLLTPRHGTRELDEGQSMVEYALILFLTTLVCIAGLTAVGVNAKQYLWDTVDLIINGALGGV